MNNTEILDGHELVRILVRVRDARGSRMVTRDQTSLRCGGSTHSVKNGLIEKLINDGWLVESMWRGQFEVDPDRIDEWSAIDTERESLCRQLIVDRHSPHCTFTAHGYNVAYNPHSPDHNARGFCFSDTDGNGFLVTAGGGVLPLMQLIKL